MTLSAGCFRNPVVVICLGATAEWLEFSAYLYLAPVLSRLFFPLQNSATSMLSLFAMFATSYIVRPFGGALFGFMADRFGRRMTLYISVLMMSVATTGIGFLPTYFEIGIWAPLLLMFFRMLQGLAVAGEFTNAAVYMVEHGKGNVFLAGSLANWGANLGIILGALSTAVVHLPWMPAWSWRLPFLLSCVTMLLAFFIRFRLMESPEFHLHLAKRLKFNNVLLKLWSHYKSVSVCVICFATFSGVVMYVGNMFWCSFVIGHNFFSATVADTIAALDMAVEFICLPLMAMLAMKIGPLRVMSFGALLCAFVAPLSFQLAEQEHLLLSSAIMILFAIGVSAFEAPMFGIMASFFPAAIRCTGIAVSWGIGSTLFSAPSLFFAQWLSQRLEEPWMAGALCVVTAAITGFVALVFLKVSQLKETKRIWRWVG